MPSEKERTARMMKRQTERIDRLENERFSEAVPNPLVAVTEGTTTDDTATTSTKPRGSFSWGDRWRLSEWNGAGGAAQTDAERVVAEPTSTDDTTTVASKPAGSFSWGDRWRLSEWPESGAS